MGTKRDNEENGAVWCLSILKRVRFFKDLMNCLTEVYDRYLIRLSIVVVFLFFISALISVRVKGQDYQKLERLVDETEEVKMVSSSDNGRWLGYYSDTGDGKKRKMIIQNTANPKQVIERSDINRWMFVKDHVGVISSNRMEYIDLRSGRSTVYLNVKTIDYDEKHNVLLVHYNKEEQNKLELYTPDGNLLQTLDRVSFFSFNGSRLIVRRKLEQLNEVWVMKGRGLIKLYSTADELKNVFPSGMKEGGFVINTRKEGKFSRIYITEDLREYAFKDDRYVDYEDMSVITSRADDRLILKLTRLVPKEKGLVDVWYGTDFNLSKNVRATRKAVQIDWNPLKGEQTLLTHPDYFGETALGNALYLKYAVDKYQVDVMDKAAGNGSDRLYLWNSVTDVYTFVADVQKKVVISPSGQYLLIEHSDGWKLFDTQSLRLEELDISAIATPYFTSSHEALWTDGGKVYRMDLRSNLKTDLYQFKDSFVELLNFERISTELQYPREFRYIDIKQGLLLKISNPMTNTQSYGWFKDNKMTVIIPPTKDHITEFAKIKYTDDFYWIQENYNQLPAVKIKRSNEKSKTLYVSNLAIKQSERAEVKKICYKGADGEQITGTLYMPLNYDRSKKYPVVVHIYEKQEYLTNRFLRPSFANGTGLNIALLIEQDFVVLLPDISYSDKGPGISALESVNNALDELQKIENVDMDRIGLMGQSFGGYETNFIATQSKRFAAYISGASVSDIIRTYYAFNENFNAPDYYRYEGGQNNFKYTVAENPEKYIRNNPIMYAQNINAPMLLWAGKEDGNVSPEGIRSLYIALRKYRKPVVALFYEKERHSLSTSEAQKDLTLRVLDWFSYFLKDQRDILWVKKQMKGAE